VTLVAQKASDIYQRFRRVQLHWQFHGEDKQRAHLTDFVRRLSPYELELAVGDVHEDLRNMAGLELKIRQDAGSVPVYRPGEVRAMDIIEQLKRDEGYERFMYLDTQGVPTIGYGFNLRDEGLSPDESEYVLRCKVAQRRINLVNALTWTAQLDDARQGVLLNMAYNLGLAGLLGFPKMLAAMKTGDYDTAAGELLGSLYATQVGARAQRLAVQLRTGEWQ